MRVYMIVTDDKYELPLAVCDNLPQLQAATGRSYSSLKCYMSRQKNARNLRRSIWKYKIIRVDLEDVQC